MHFLSMFFFGLEKLPFTESPMNIMQWIYDILLLTDAHLLFQNSIFRCEDFRYKINSRVYIPGLK